MKLLQFALAFLLPAIYFADLVYFKKYYLLLLAGFVILPITETFMCVLGIDKLYESVLEINVPFPQKEKMFKRIMYIWVPCGYLLSILTVYCANTTELSLLEYSLLIASMGFINGSIGIAVAHELFHKSNLFDKLMGYAQLLLNNYMHFRYTHIKIHHTHVATDEDPTSAKLGQSIYDYYCRTIFVNVCQHIMKKPLHFLMINTPVILLIGILYKCFGMKIVMLYLMNGWFAAIMSESGNYIQHYGLRRKKLADGNYEPVNRHHSWNSFHPLTGAMLVQLPSTHSWHHMIWTTEFQKCEIYRDVPTMPFNFPMMVMIALFPPLWWAMMNPRVELYQLKQSLKGISSINDVQLKKNV
jgi:alkane 1-monooxygenase